MNIKTKHNLGDKFWVIYKADGEVSCYVDTIEEIVINKDGIILYFGEFCNEEMREEEMIMEDEKDKIADAVIKEWEKIKKEDEEDDKEFCP